MGICSRPLKRSALTFELKMAIGLHQATSYLSSADIEPAKWGQRRDLNLTQTFITDWNWFFFFVCVLDALFDLPCFYCFQKSHMLYSPSAFLGRRDVCMSSEREGVPKHIEMFLFEEKKNKKKTSRFDFWNTLEPLWEACTMALTCSNSK